MLKFLREKFTRSVVAIRTILREFGGAEERLDGDDLLGRPLEGQGVDAVDGVAGEVRHVWKWNMFHQS